MKSTPLASLHARLGAGMGHEEGWNMPQTFTSLIEEHLAARSSCGIFDISHLAKFSVVGNGALGWLESMLSNAIANCNDNQTQQTLLLNEDGSIIDKITLCRESAGRFFLLASPSMEETVYRWLQSHLPDAPLELHNETGLWSAMSLYGPDSEKVFSRVLRGLDMPLPAHFERVSYQHDELLLMRAGMQGEEGFEMFCPANAGISWFESFIAAGAIPCGMATRECIRLEHGCAAPWRDAPSLSPLDASLESLCDKNKDYIGAQAWQRQPAPPKRLVSLRCTEESDTPIPGCEVKTPSGLSVGSITSGCISPTHGCGLALARIAAESARPGTKLCIIIHGHSVPAVVTDAKLN